ncbi:glucose-6-phosphate dehydrogenase [Williamsia sp. Leaf354]|uniref:glucose-6-phosphate dehydrogenase n=1 Tax=Williamsia sp. Leaf354 TaxID=1736349 RepID=UPI0006FF850A|nr:glucose-6-phosphate dehydrogenase (NADP(+)) [Williamsia sp. Leaf354]KQR98552.1 glucose-6-phosphate dehydrogenase [Williamsia sp. Leaf354]
MPDSTSGADTPTVFVLFGATGDLAKRMVLPAFYELAQRELLPTRWKLIGNGRGERTDDEFRQHVADALTEFGDGTDDHWDAFAKNLRFAGGGFTVDDPGQLPDVIDEIRNGGDDGAGDFSGDDVQLVHYIALPPATFTDYTKALGEHGLDEGARVVYEKPFGTSQKSFEELDVAVHEVFDEKQVYRIDHFLGKESTQNLHIIRFANGMFAGLWNREHVEQVQIDIPETLDIDDRAEFYDATGAVLDMLVTHLFQVAAEVAMEPPLSLRADDLQTARESVIAAFRPIDTDEVVLGQYEGYRDTEGIADDSDTDTYVAARMWVDTDRWRDVPFVLRTGKMLGVSAQRVTLVFRRPEDGPVTHLPADGAALTFDLSGDGEIDITLTVKTPGPGEELSVAHMELPLSSIETNGGGLSPYSRLLFDVLDGDRSLFTRPDGLAHVWEVAAPLLDNPPAIASYAPGSMGPHAADALADPVGWFVSGR